MPRKPPRRVRLQFHALIYQEGELWLAHCLDLDVVAQAATGDEAVQGMLDAVDAILRDAKDQGVPLSRLVAENRAPDELWERYHSTKWTREGIKHKPRTERRSPEPPTMELEARVELCEA